MAETTEICTQFVRVTNDLVAARRTSAAELAKQLQEAEKNLEAEVQKANAARLELAQQQSQNALMQAMLAKLAIGTHTDGGKQTSGGK